MRIGAALEIATATPAMVVVKNKDEDRGCTRDFPARIKKKIFLVP